MTPLQSTLLNLRNTAHNDHEFELLFAQLAICFFRYEPKFREAYRSVVEYSTWAESHNIHKQAATIDLICTTFSGETHAVLCRNNLNNTFRSHIGSFLQASTDHTLRVILSIADDLTDQELESLAKEKPTVVILNIGELERSIIDWASFAPNTQPIVRPRKVLWPHQQSAVDRVVNGLSNFDRGKLIMACGTGKTLTSLKIAEQIAGAGGSVLFLVPSLALLSQTLTEWTQESQTPIRCFAVCSDSDVGRRRFRQNNDILRRSVHELSYPATTNASRLAEQMKTLLSPVHMAVVFATYQSIAAVSSAQQNYELPSFELIVSDEAHRTAGVRSGDSDDSCFIRVHDETYVRGKKRLYMTATPRIYADSTRAAAERENTSLCSMDDETLYGPMLSVLSFSEAVRRGLLVDYKVVVVVVDESHVSRRLERYYAGGEADIDVRDAAMIVGCRKALSKDGLSSDSCGDDSPMRRSVAFCQVIDVERHAKTHKVASKHIAKKFFEVVKAYMASQNSDSSSTELAFECKHIDGSMNASEKTEKIEWLRSPPDDASCRILCNVRCLSEGVDVPVLDAVMFLHPRDSQIDVVQSVGRVMRRAEGKRRGFIILPVVVPSETTAHDALNDNATYKVVWQVFAALRSHDDRFDAMICRFDLGVFDRSKLEILVISDDYSRYCPNSTPSFAASEIERDVCAKLMLKVGRRTYWDVWSADVGRIVRSHINAITAILDNSANFREREAFDNFVKTLRRDLSSNIAKSEVIEMLGQHIVTEPVFDALFSDCCFTEQNPVSKSMQTILGIIDAGCLDRKMGTLVDFYDSVKMRASGIPAGPAKQKLVLELYEKFFKNAFPKMAERLGIVYTPVEIVDFILRSVDYILRNDFDKSLSDECVTVLDPFTGTGTFVSRLLDIGLIDKENLERKYSREIFANEIALLAYYVAAINIEGTYAGLMGGKHKPFPGLSLIDTLDKPPRPPPVRTTPNNNDMGGLCDSTEIRVVVGNPPYSARQAFQNDNNQNVKYPSLDRRIAQTYAAQSTAVNKNTLYDSYFRAIRWASDRIGNRGVLGFVTNAGFIDSISADGFRKCLAEEFSKVYVFNLRGNLRTSGETAKKEGQSVFASTRIAAAISICVKNPDAQGRHAIYYHDVGNYLTRDEKLSIVSRYKSIEGIASARCWTEIQPDTHGDWLKKRDACHCKLFPLVSTTRDEPSIFARVSVGVGTCRDAWAFNPSRRGLTKNMKRMIDFYNLEAARLSDSLYGMDSKQREAHIRESINTDSKLISWDNKLIAALARGKRTFFNPTAIVTSLYRPFTKQMLYFDSFCNSRQGNIPEFYPSIHTKNLTILVRRSSGPGPLALLSDSIPERQTLGNVHCFPLFIYDKHPTLSDPDNRETEPRTKPDARLDGITDAGLAHFQSAFSGEILKKDDLFYYIYGILHSKEFCHRYADTFAREQPRIPRAKTENNFRIFSRAGRTLGFLHVNYERVREFKGIIIDGPTHPTPSHYRVEKMRFGTGQNKEKDKSVIHYNKHFTIRNIPIEAYDYIINGKSAIEWIMKHQSVRTDSTSGIIKDANEYATEIVGDPRYPLSLLLRIITVSLSTMKIVNSLPAPDVFDD